MELRSQSRGPVFFEVPSEFGQRDALFASRVQRRFVFDVPAVLVAFLLLNYQIFLHILLKL